MSIAMETSRPAAAESPLQPVSADMAAGGAGLVCTAIEDRGRLDSLSGQWNALLADSPSNSVFLSWEWAGAWMDAVYPDAPLLVIAVHDGDGRLVGLAPFYRTTLTLLSTVTYKCLRIIGDCNSGSDYPDIIARPGMKDQVLAKVVQCLMERKESWDLLWMPAMAAWADQAGPLDRACRDFSLLRSARDRTYMAIPLPGSYESYLAKLGTKSRSNIRKYSKMLLGGNWRLDFCRRKEDLPRMLDSLMALHRKRWQAVGEAGSFDRKPALARFYRRFAPVALEKGWLRLLTLVIDEEPQAALYGYVHNGVFSAVQCGCNLELEGAGTVLWTLAIKNSIEEGLREFDYLQGEDEYKRRLGAVPRTGREMFIGRPTLKNLPLFRAGIWPTGRYMRRGLPERG
jgi:CelD/BcsL family acetyltransferase involved in cellulose biosynthesis